MQSDNSILTVPKDGIYIFQLSIESPGPNFNASTNVKFIASHGMLTAKDFPLLHVRKFIFITYEIILNPFCSFMLSCAYTTRSWQFFGQ